MSRCGDRQARVCGLHAVPVLSRSLDRHPDLAARMLSRSLFAHSAAMFPSTQESGCDCGCECTREGEAGQREAGKLETSDVRNDAEGHREREREASFILKRQSLAVARPASLLLIPSLAADPWNPSA